MLSLLDWPKVITLSGFNCNTNRDHIMWSIFLYLETSTRWNILLAFSSVTNNIVHSHFSVYNTLSHVYSCLRPVLRNKQWLIDSKELQILSTKRQSTCERKSKDSKCSVRQAQSYKTFRRQSSLNGLSWAPKSNQKLWRLKVL